jgi:hypothetical protein
MYNLNMVSRGFSHAPSSTWYKKSDHITWDYGSKDNDITFYIDADLSQGLNDKNDGKLKFLWGLESPQYNNNFVQEVKNNLDEILETFELIFTYSDELLSLHPKFVFCPANGFWIMEPKIYEKSKIISMICSDKTKTELQKFRLNFANSNKDKIDLFGHAFKGIPQKDEGFKDYMFSVCIENDDSDTYFTEKILDAFATGTIPIYKGTKKITNHFNENGIIFLDDINIEDLTPEIYHSKKTAILDNYNRVLKFNVLENWMYNQYLYKYLKNEQN